MVAAEAYALHAARLDGPEAAGMDQRVAARMRKGSATSMADYIAIDGGEKYCDGFAPHDYVGNASVNFYADPFWRFLDFSAQQTRQYGKKLQWMTEGGDSVYPDRGHPDLKPPAECYRRRRPPEPRRRRR